VAQPIEQAPEWVRQLYPSPEGLAALHAQGEAAIAAHQRGEPSAVVTFEELFRQMDAEEPGAQAV
jgi:hypothetical protein